jgi:hypothetical protein
MWANEYEFWNSEVKDEISFWYCLVRMVQHLCPVILCFFLSRSFSTLVIFPSVCEWGSNFFPLGMISNKLASIYNFTRSNFFVRAKIWMNIVEIQCTHVWKLKNETFWSYSRNGGVKENSGWGEFNYDIS